MITVPTVNWPAGVDSFEAKLNEEIDKTTSPISGTKTFDIPFSVSKMGLIKIPAVRFSYFDEKTKSYETISTDTLQLNVTAAVKQKVSIQTDDSATVTEKGKGIDLWLAGAGGLVLLAGAIFFLVTRKKQAVEKPNAAAEKEVELQPRKTVAEFLKPAIYIQDGLHHKQFYTLLMEGVREFFIDRLELPLYNNRNTTIIDALKQNHCTDLAEQYQQIVSDCEMVVFSGVAMHDSKDQLLQHANELMTEADKRI